MELAKCNAIECERSVYRDGDKCILHAEKNNWEDSSENRQSFTNELIKYIVFSLDSSYEENSNLNRDTLINFLNKNSRQSDNVRNQNKSFIKESIIEFSFVSFPKCNPKERFNYFKVLSMFGGIHFNYCEFNITTLDLGRTKCFYQDCEFNEKWNIYNSPKITNENGVLYQGCVFNETVYCLRKDLEEDDYITKDEEVNIISEALFSDCEFKYDISFEGIDFKAPIFINDDDSCVSCNINVFSIMNCKFRERFVLNNCTISLFLSKGSEFKSKFEFKNNRVKSFDEFNTNHYGIVDNYETRYEKFRVQKCIFNDFVGFEKCFFGKIYNDDVNFLAKFMYATFMSFVNFRNTTFYSGLDIEHANLKEPPNFLNAKINSAHTNRETFRIIKNAFDKAGNHIEANKFFVHEMAKYNEELKDSPLTQEKFVFKINNWASGFGRSYMKPIGWIVFFSIIYYWVILGYENGVLYNIAPVANDAISSVAGCLNGIAKNILPFSRILKSGMEFISLFFYIIFASLIWLTIVSIKRHTKR